MEPQKRREVPYHRSRIGEAEIEAVTEVLRSGWLTAGPRTAAFEAAFARHKQIGHALAVHSCTAALFLAVKALELRPGDEVITTPLTFAATANVVHHCGLVPVFADVDPDTLNLCPEKAAERINLHTRALLPVHLGGNPADMAALLALAREYQLHLIEDCAHAVEGSFGGQALGTLGQAGCFSFYPTKNITAGEGGMVITADEDYARRMRQLSRHGLSQSVYERDGDPLYDILLPGYKYNMTDIQAAIGLAQMDRIPEMYAARQALDARYRAAFAGTDSVRLTQPQAGGVSALHLFLLRIRPEMLRIHRDEILRQARAAGVHLSVNYLPVHLFTWYREAFGYQPGDLPVAEDAGQTVISLPFYPDLQPDDADYVVDVLQDILSRNRR